MFFIIGIQGLIRTVWCQAPPLAAALTISVDASPWGIGWGFVLPGAPCSMVRRWPFRRGPKAVPGRPR